MGCDILLCKVSFAVISVKYRHRLLCLTFFGNLPQIKDLGIPKKISLNSLSCYSLAPLFNRKRLRDSTLSAKEKRLIVKSINRFSIYQEVNLCISLGVYLVPILLFG